MPDDQEDLTAVPLPSSETEAEHRRIRSSNDRDQKDEREHRKNHHNAGYDQAADGKIPDPKLDDVTNE